MCREVCTGEGEGVKRYTRRVYDSVRVLRKGDERAGEREKKGV